MDEMPNQADPFLDGLSRRLVGSRRSRQRLLAEIRDHLEDAVAANLASGLGQADAERNAVEALGSVEALLDAWKIRCTRKDRRTRRHVAATIAAAAVTVVLAVAQHAQGRHTPYTAASTTVASAHSAETSLASRQPTWVHTAVKKIDASYSATSGAKPVAIFYVSYPRKIAVVLEFDRIVRCGCGPTYPGPGGKVIRFSLDRTTHLQGNEWRYCEVHDDVPPLQSCLQK